MPEYKTKKKRLLGTNVKDIEKSALLVFKVIKSRTKRTPYIRSKYLRREKIFLTRENFKKKDELLHRFTGSTQKNEKFIVQIKENKRTKRKDFISVYPK